MSLATPANAGDVFVGRDLCRLTVEQYHELIDAGILMDGDPVELLEGVLVRKMPRNPPHSGTVLQLRTLLESLLPSGWRYRSEQPIILGDGEPEPDGVIARGTPEDNFTFHPLGADVTLVIEVSDSTLERDRGIKLRSYARAGIPVYWLVNLIERQVEVHTDPDPSATPESTYRRRDVYAGDAAVPLSLDGQPLAAFAAAALLPPQ